MSRLFGTLVVALLTVAVPAAAYAGQDKKKEAAPKTMNAMGSVTAVSGTSLTVKGKDAEWTFTIDKDTKVVGKGASTKTAEMKKEGKATTITDFVKEGDQVRVSYHDMGATKHAANVTVTASAPAMKKK
jgi:uncharacterized protein YxeA